MSDETEHKFTKEDIDLFRTNLEALDGIKNQIVELEKNGKGTAEKQEERDKAVEAIVAQHEELQAKQTALETQLTRKDEEETKDAKPDFGAYFKARGQIALRSRSGGLIPDEMREAVNIGEDAEIKALTVADDTAAGFLVPEDWRAELIEKDLVEIDPLRSLARVVTTNRNSIQWPSKTAHVSATWEAEGATSTADTNLAFGNIEIPVHKIRVVVDATTEMIEDSAFNIESLLRDEFSTQLSFEEGEQFIAGNGIGKPTGFTTDATIQAAATDSGTADSISSDWEWVPKLMVSLKRPYMNASTWLMNRTTFGVVLSTNDGESRPYMLPNTDRALPMVIYGHNIELSESMPDVAADAFPIAFGDFRKGYIIVDRVGMSIQVDPFTQNMTDKVRFIGRMRVGGAVVVPEAIALLKVSA